MIIPRWRNETNVRAGARMHKAEPASKIDAAAKGRSLTVAALLGGENASIGAATVRNDFPTGCGIFIIRCDAAGVMSNLCDYSPGSSRRKTKATKPARMR